MSADEMQREETATQLLHLEKSLLDPAVRCNSAQVSALLAEDFIEFGSSGRRWTRNEILNLLATEVYDPPAVEDFECRFISDGVVLVTYRAVRLNLKTHNRSVSLRSSLWTKESGVWLLRFHQGTQAA